MLTSPVWEASPDGRNIIICFTDCSGWEELHMEVLLLLQQLQKKAKQSILGE